MSKSTQGHIQNVPMLAAMAMLLVVVIVFLMVLLMPSVVGLVDHRMPLAWPPC